VTRDALRLVRLGVLLLLLGLLTGAVIPSLAVPRLGLSAHILGVLGGLGSVVFGLVWPRLRLGSRASALGCWLAVYSFYAGWLMPLLGGAWGAGGGMLPIAAGAARGTAFQEGVIAAGLVTAAVAIVAVCLLVLWGLRAPAREP
jgi:hydroxylaminobenzene mutase